VRPRAVPIEGIACGDPAIARARRHLDWVFESEAYVAFEDGSGAVDLQFWLGAIVSIIADSDQTVGGPVMRWRGKGLILETPLDMPEDRFATWGLNVACYSPLLADLPTLALQVL
jgi:hypothetical protein